jgi:phosphatidate cytidylyltransferase
MGVRFLSHFFNGLLAYFDRIEYDNPFFGPSNTVYPMLRWRLLLGFAIIAALVGLCWADHLASTPGIYLLPLGLLLIVWGSSELLELLKAGGMNPRKRIVYGGNILLFASCWLPTIFARFDLPLNPAFEEFPLCLFAVCVLAVFFGEMSRYEKPGGILVNLAGSVFALAYIGLMFYFIGQLRMVRGLGVGALVSMIIVVKMGDTGAYTVGRLFGRHKMAPRLSPGKTLEGAAGAILFACFGSWLCFQYLLPAIAPSNPRQGYPGGWLIYGVLLGLVGMFGDLAESLLKRDVGRKDSSTWIPGFGGVLDIFDSLLLAAPVAWLCWSWAIV